MDKADLMTKAARLRRQLGCDESLPIDIFPLASNITGLTIVFYPMGDNLSGMCVKIEDGLSLIAINSDMSYGRQRFSMAHEFYHLYYDKSNNLRDVKSYVAEYNLRLLTTGDILKEALQRGILDENTGNKIWSQMLKKKRKLGYASFSQFLAQN